MIFNLNHFVDQLYGGQSSRISNWFAVRMKRSEAGKMPCERNIVVLHYFRGEKSSEQWELEIQYLLKYKVGLNLLYPKIGEMDPYAMQQGSEFRGTVFVTRFRIKYGFGK